MMRCNKHDVDYVQVPFSGGMRISSVDGKGKIILDTPEFLCPKCFREELVEKLKTDMRDCFTDAEIEVVADSLTPPLNIVHESSIEKIELDEDSFRQINDLLS